MIIFDKKTSTYTINGNKTAKPHGGYYYHSDGMLLKSDEYGTPRIVGHFATLEEAESHMLEIENNFIRN